MSSSAFQSHLRDCLKNVKLYKTERTYNPVKSLRVSKVPGDSLAALAGVQVNDVLAFVEYQGKLEPAFGMDLWNYSSACDENAFYFYRARTGEWLDVETNGCPLGMETMPTHEAICQNCRRNQFFNPNFGLYYDLPDLWDLKQDKTLKEIYAIESRPFAEKNLGDALVHLFLCQTAKKHRYFISHFLRGILLYEEGKVQEAGKLFDVFMQKLPPVWWVRSIPAIVLYYLAQASAQAGDKDSAEKYLYDAKDRFRSSQRIEEAYKERVGRELIIPDVWTRKEFPHFYKLKNITPWLKNKPPEITGLRETLEKMQEQQIFLVCLLAGWRTNGPYVRFLKRYAALKKRLPAFVAGMHVITHMPEYEPDRLDEAQSERELLEHLGIPFDVLLDPDEKLANDLDINAAPSIFALNRQGVILGQFTYDESGLWSILARLSAPAA
jgi:hypothetical protein